MSSISLVRGRRWVSGATALVLGATLLVPLAPAAAAAPAPTGANAPCADVMPLADVATGQVGTGWTVVRGQTPKPFRVRILGIYPDGVAPGRDMIMVEVSDLPGRRVVAAGDGIWSGMSGSPVYVEGKLVGAVAYGFSTGPSKIGGLAPAEDMAKLLTLPDPAVARAAESATRPTPTRLSRSLRSALTARTGRSVAAAGEFDRLAVPIAISGVPERGRTLFGERLDAAGVRARVTRGSRADAPAGAFTTPMPGGNFAAMIAYGDVSVGGIGTTTWVCGDRALAFGHPLALTGPTSFGANDATSLAIVKDPTFGPFKLASVGDPFGVLDQDRLAGIRAHLGETPTLLPVIAAVRDLDLGVARTGRTFVTRADWMSYVAPQHLYADMISVTDREGPGTAVLKITVNGERANGDPWTLIVADRIASGFSIQYESARELDSLLGRITDAATEDVRITRVRVEAKVEEAVRIARIARLAVSRNGGAFRALPETLRVRTGDSLVFRVFLRERSGGVRVVNLPLTIPADAQGFGMVGVAGGASLGTACDFDPQSCPAGFKALLRLLASQPRGDDLLAQLVLESPDGTTFAAETRARQPVVVDGFETVVLDIR